MRNPRLRIDPALPIVPLMARITRALLSVSDKTGLVDFARILARAGIELLSTGGTAARLRKEGLEVTDLSAWTGFPEMLDGRVKTLHPRVHGGLLFLRDDPGHRKAVEEHGIGPIDLVVVNLYPFESTVARPRTTPEEAIENIDIGGPAMLRSAAKNHASVTVVTDPRDYRHVGEQIRLHGRTTPELRQQLAARVFVRTAAYDRAIADHLQGIRSPSALPEELDLHLSRSMTLRYGENPHQQGALYGTFEKRFTQLHGKALSYNNILDLTAAADLVTEFENERPAMVILKHANPCGAGQGDTLLKAWEKALATDRQSPFGGIIAANAPLDGPCAEAIAEIFSEVIVAPGFTPEALGILTRRKNLRLIRRNSAEPADLQIRSVGRDILLVQECDRTPSGESEWKVVTRRAPDPEEMSALRFGWRVVRHVKSNAVVLAGPEGTLGIGAGQMSRVDAGELAVRKAGKAGLSLVGSAVCSDAFFPFADGLLAAARAGATAAIQPGGSVRDREVIEAADDKGMAMVFTGRRHFRH